MDIKYKRILLKLSGESLMGEKQYGIDEKRLNEYAEQIKEIAGLGIEIGIVIGGGNIFRGLSGAAKGFDRVKGDQMGMLATVINSLALSSALDSLGQKAHVFTATNMFPIGEHYSKWKAIDAMKRGEIAIISGGTGNPYFSTDTGAALRAAEIQADVLLQAKNIDGVYDSDPKKNSDAKKYDKIGYLDVIKDGLQVMDTTAVSLCMENHIPIVTFALNEKDSIYKAATGQKIGTIIE